MLDLQTRVGAAELDLPLCVTCSTQTSYRGTGLDLDAEDSEYKCRICLDPRQFVGREGQEWTSFARLISSGTYRNEVIELMPNVWSLRTIPQFGIGQRMFLIKTEGGLIAWDCIAYFDDATLALIDEKSAGRGLVHMAVSHPHYYSTTKVWMDAFPEMTMHLADVDFEPFYQRRDVVQAVPANLNLLKEVNTPLAGCEATIMLLGGHFPGSLVMLWRDVLFVADTIQVVPSGIYSSTEKQRDGVLTFSFLWSYPNQIPLSAAEVQRVCKPLEHVHFRRAFGAFDGFNIWDHAKEKVFQSRDIVLNRLGAE